MISWADVKKNKEAKLMPKKESKTNQTRPDSEELFRLFIKSTEQITACTLLYIESVIKGRKKPGGLESARGNQVHKVHS